MKKSLLAAVVAAGAFGATAASAVTVYKITDTKGHVTYQNEPPRIDDVAHTQRKEINPNENIMVNERRAVGASQSGGSNLDQTNLRALDELIRRAVATGQTSNTNAPAPVSSGINARRLDTIGAASGSAPNQGGTGTGELITADNGIANNTGGAVNGTTTSGTVSGGTTSNFGGTTSNYGGTTSNFGGTTSNFGSGTGASSADGSSFGSSSTGGSTSNGLSTNTAPGTTVFPNGMNTDIGGVNGSDGTLSGNTTSNNSGFGSTGTTGNTTGTTSFGSGTTTGTTSGTTTNSTANFGNTGAITGTQGSTVPSPNSGNNATSTFGSGASGTGTTGSTGTGTAGTAGTTNSGGTGVR